MSNTTLNLTSTNEALTSTLNNLIEICLDGYEGYMQIARGVKLQLFRALFESYTEQRDQFVGELVSLMIAQGDKPTDRGNVPGALRPGWGNVRTVASAGNASMILAKCEQAETAAIEAYEYALSVGLPQEVRDVVERQYNNILRARALIGDLRRQHYQN
jgi:uncharacterized protein (TIGR02284 family)